MLTTISNTKTETGRLDVLVNAAGCSFSTLLVASPSERIQNVVDTNLIATIHACSAAGRHLKKTSGSIINVSSLLAQKGVRGESAYAASKAGIIGKPKHQLPHWGKHLSPWFPSLTSSPPSQASHGL